MRDIWTHSAVRTLKFKYIIIGAAHTYSMVRSGTFRRHLRTEQTGQQRIAIMLFCFCRTRISLTHFALMGRIGSWHYSTASYMIGSHDIFNTESCKFRG